MTSPGSAPQTGRIAVVGRVLAGIVAAGAGAVFLLTAWMALSSRFGWNDRDLHGYGLIFGTFAAILAGLVVALVLPVALGARRTGRTYAVTMAVYVVCVVLLIVALVTA